VIHCGRQQRRSLNDEASVRVAIHSQANSDVTVGRSLAIPTTDVATSQECDRCHDDDSDRRQQHRAA
jgi:cytochrome c553